ncbi:MAG TPA: DUF3343 domain-containing protein [Candidatus Flavonifractor merdipullorum]|uniref:DUF3343 domain-containing protein n=1 Tax=Candidatus Flavonifractor merdipullorum TaxID=2838590 RepID=A0A9D1RUY5_9FIRM|nr:DUF3343 domain-containing protein [Candidatus Flavonifractor merdipullorum]
MVYYLILCRSLTYAQRTAAVLERAGITAHLLRSPKRVVGEGCGYSVKVSERNLAAALLALRRAGLSPKQVFLTAGDGSYREVHL